MHLRIERGMSVLDVTAKLPHARHANTCDARGGGVRSALVRNTSGRPQQGQNNCHSDGRAALIVQSRILMTNASSREWTSADWRVQQCRTRRLGETIGRNPYADRRRARCV